MKRRSFSLLLLLVLLPALGYFAWRQTSVRMGGTPARLRGSAASEEEWIVREVVEDVSHMSAAASGAPVPELEVVGSGSEWRVRGSAPEVEVSLQLVPFFWAPEAYVDLIATIGTAAPIPVSADTEFPRRLLSAGTSDLVDEDLRISAALASTPASSASHEEAALLLAAVGFLESAGEFSDLRPVFHRMTAHLAMAESLRGSAQPSEAGRIARAALLVLTGRERDAQGWIESIADPIWRLLLRVRLTDDWRMLDELPRHTRFEKLEWFRAMARTMDTSTAMDRYYAAFPGEEPDLDWHRIAIQEHEGPADGGHLGPELLQRELGAIASTRARYEDSGRPLEVALNDPPEGLYGPDGLPRVLGWSHWAAFYQRHLCDHLFKTDSYYRIALGLPEEAESFRAGADAQLRGLLLHPFVRMRRTARAGVRVEDIDGFGDVVRATVPNPERINGANWYFASWTTAQMALRKGMPNPAHWFSLVLASQSSFDSRRRLWHFGRHRSPEDVALLSELAPSSSQVWRLFVELPRTEPVDLDVESLLEAMGPRAEYDIHALRDVEEFAERYGQDSRPVHERTCGIEPSTCVHLGEVLAARGEAEDAAAAFRRAFDLASDRVHVSNHMKWLIRHDRAHGNTREAMIVAREGASTGSSLGLTNLAWLLEDLGSFDEAESLQVANFERYENPSELIGFYFRLARTRGRAGYEPKLASAASEVFPDGIQTYDPADNDTPPRDGAVFDSTSDRLREAGLMAGDVVVALDGFRVRSFGQYEAVRAFTISPELKLVVWRVNRYLEIIPRSHDRRFGVQMVDYRPRYSIDSIGN